MPTYEYRCQVCSHECEAMQKMADPALVRCPACGKDGLTRLISRSSFQLKGEGWYKTDYKKTAPTSNTATSEASSASEKSESAPAESKTTSSETT